MYEINLRYKLERNSIYKDCTDFLSMDHLLETGLIFIDIAAYENTMGNSTPPPLGVSIR